MKEIIVKNQKQLDKIKLDYDGLICIEGGTKENPINLFTNFQKATVIVRGNAYLENVYDSAQIGHVYGSAQINLYGESVVHAYYAKKIVCHGYNTVIVHKSDKGKIGLIINKDSNLVILPDNTLKTEPTFKEFYKMYGVKIKNEKTAILYKAVHKKDGIYFSDRENKFTYSIGEIKEHEIDKQNINSCSVGLHVSTKFWALRFGSSWDNMALLECEVPIKNIIVAKDTDGKVRTSKLKVVREVPKEEYYGF